ncbi:MAG: class I SAM-dependent methyltransferase [Vampirovibrionia bacterium]
MFTAGEIAGLKNDLREFYNNFLKYTTINSFYQISKLTTDNKYTKYVMRYIEPESKVLDIGMGAGILTLEMARISKDVTGIDVASSVVDYAAGLKNIELRRYKLIEDYKKQNYNTDQMSNINYQVCDAEALSFKNNTFDIIVAQDIIEHLPAPIKALNEMIRCLKDNGKIILILHTPELDTNLNIESWKQNIAKMKNKDAVSKMNYSVLSTWIKRKKLKVDKLKVTYNNPFINLLTSLITKLQGALFIEKFEDTIILILEK